MTRTPQNVANFVWNFDQWWRARWCIRYAKALIQSIKKWSKLGQKSYFLAHFKSFFVYALLHPMSYDPRFCQMKYVIKIYLIFVKLKIFKVFGTDSASMKWLLFGFFGPLHPKILFNLAEIFWPEVVSNKANTAFEKSFKILSITSNETHAKFTVLVQFAAQFKNPKILVFKYLRNTTKILLKTQISAKTVSFGVSNNISLRSQKNHRILAKKWR